MMTYKKIILINLAIIFMSGCEHVPTLDDVMPDRRTEYQKSEALPDLEVPPDLTTEALEDPLTIPNEEVTTLSAFERQKIRRQQGNATAADLAGIGGFGDDQWLALQGTSIEIWPKLREFWTNKNYTLDLDDAELGVLETDWLGSGGDGITVFRNKFKIFSEAGKTSGSTVLFISSERQEKIVNAEGSEEWVDLEKSVELERAIVGELNLHFYGKTASPSAATSSTSSASTSARASRPARASTKRKRAEMLNLDEEKSYLSLPEEFSRAWTKIEEALNRAGLFVEGQDKSKGLYYIVYFSDPEGEDESLLSKLKFWEGDNEEEGEEYQVSLTGVGDKTELVVLDSEGNWAERKNTVRILSMLQAQYNSMIR